MKASKPAGALRSDVCLVLEGSYPYVTGGVASWVHQLIVGLPDLRFSILCLVPDAEFPRIDRYVLPGNVVDRTDVCLFEPVVDTGERRELAAPLVAALHALHDAPVASRCPLFGQVERLARLGGHHAQTLMTSQTAWELIRRLYVERKRDVSFLDYFWTWRAIHAPLFRLLAADLPDAAVYHALSTGYAGLLASIATLRSGARMVLTEHGLYTQEREIEIFQADWIFQARHPNVSGLQAQFFKRWWRDTFRGLGQLAYDRASRIVTLHGLNRAQQIEAGAPEHKLDVVANGIRAERYAPARHARDWGHRPFRVGLIGRVVPIKDIKTFLRAVAIAAGEVSLEAYVLGPDDEDPGYARECRALAAGLGLDGVVAFEGPVDVMGWLPRLDLNVLTSISESQPLVILEAAAAGLPSVATDVGACREMLEGRTDADRALGPSGLVTPVVSPEATARALVSLACDPAAHARMGEAAVRRVEGFYRQHDVFDYYRGLYGSLAKPVRSARRAG